MKIVTREQWGARAPRSIPTPVQWSQGGPLYVHHTDGPTTQTPRQIQNFHMDTRKWSDIGYHFLVDRAGVIYEGRPYETWGAHSPVANQYPSVALIGNYSTTTPTPAQKRAVWAIKEYVKAGTLRGHRDGYATSCPGNAAYSYIVQGGPPAPETVRRYYFERTNGPGHWGPYNRKLIRNARYARTKLAHPTWRLRAFSVLEVKR